MKKIITSSRLTAGTAVAALAIALIGRFEGLVTHAYPDPATHGAPWTICYGHTGNVHPGEKMTVQECKDLFIKDLGEYAAGVEQCIKVPLPDARYVALVSFAYNLGVGGACKSAVFRNINAGRTKQGCDALLGYNRAAGRVMGALSRRRAEERRLCLQGL